MAEKDVLRALSAELKATKKDILSACERIAPEISGGRLDAEVKELASGARISMMVRPPLKSNALKNVSWQALVRVNESDGGRAKIAVGLENYKLYAPKTRGCPVGRGTLTAIPPGIVMIRR